MYYTVYKIINEINGMIYIGVHKTDDPYDNYMGSGVGLKEDQVKYGIGNFKKEILYLMDNEEDMYKKEEELVDADFVKSDKTYNRVVGGDWCESNRNGSNIYGKNGQLGYGDENLVKIRDEYGSISNYLKINGGYDEYRTKISNSLKNYIEDNGHWWTGRRHNDETKNKISQKSKLHQSGDGNSQHGTMWIYNLEEEINKKIPCSEDLPSGWVKGRILDFKLKKKKIEEANNKSRCKEEKKKTKIETYTNYWNIYKDVSFDEFVNITGYDKTRPNLLQNFKRYVVDYKPQNGKKRG